MDQMKSIMTDKVNQLKVGGKSIITDRVNQLEVEKGKDLLIFKFETEEDGTYIYDADEINHFLNIIKEVFPKNRCLFLPDKISLDSVIKFRELQEETKSSFQKATDYLSDFKNSIQKTTDSFSDFGKSIFDFK